MDDEDGDQVDDMDDNGNPEDDVEVDVDETAQSGANQGTVLQFHTAQNGSFRLKGAGPNQVDPGQQAIFDEMTTFPFGEHDDLLDAAAFGTAWLLDRPEPRVW